MRVLVVNGGREEREVLAKHLIAAGHVVDLAADAEAAWMHFEHDAPEVMIVDWQMKPVPGADLVRKVRAEERDAHVYTIGSMAAPAPAAIAEAFAAGVDDVMRKPVVKEELVARVDALARIRRWAPHVITPSEAALDWSGAADLSKLRAWNEADRGIRSDLMDVLGRELFAVSPADRASRPFTAAAEIPLSLAAEGLEVRLMVALDAESIATVGEIVLGSADVPPGALDDVVRELANTAGGAFKRTALAEGVTLTTGLPLNVSAAAFGTKTNGLLKEFISSIDGSSARIGVRLTVNPRALERVTPEKLREGMVLGRDVVTPEGALLVPAGTRLTEATVMRLVKFLRPRALIEVAAAA